ncbi:MAG: redoxin domain-containing protein [Candidatus Nitrosocosmicus sp.]|nr:redoxin domain-containing protein [Candidatus Nitrosocosmicus sp.]MDN5868359.1 redoxin domain-containing protein [Candidatus Nitrosocosmicus sp.]
MTSIVVYVTITSAPSSYAFGDSLKKSVLTKNKEDDLQKSMTNIDISDDKVVNNDMAFQFKRAPEFQKIEGSINTNDGIPVTITSLKGEAVLVNFWTYSCINVLRTLPHLIDWDTRYSDSGLVIVGIHTPEFEFEKNTENVKSAVQRYGIKYSVLQDNVHGTWNAYENNYWPRMYLVDAHGYIRYDKIGEADYDYTEMVIRSLLNERNADNGIKNMNHSKDTFSYFNNSNTIQYSLINNVTSFLLQHVDFTKIQTPELYFGNQSSRSALGNPEGFRLGQTIDYFLPTSSSSSSSSSSSMSNSSIKPNTIYLEGRWKSNPDNVELQSDTGRILLDYSARSVNMVIGANSSDKNQSQVTVHENNSLISNKSKGIDIGNNSKFIANEPRLYNIVNHQSYNSDNHTLLIDIKGKGFQACVFTFE